MSYPITLKRIFGFCGCDVCRKFEYTWRLQFMLYVIIINIATINY